MSSSSSNEFSLIERYFHRPPRHPDVIVGIGDDAALIDTLAGRQWAVCTDTLVEGVHFFPTASVESLGWKALAVNLSDLAAMGASPVWITLALTLPHPDERWLEAFTNGLFALCDRFNIDLIGGDLTSGPLCITVQSGGHLPKGSALQRSGAQVNDLICVTGTLGDAGGGLLLAKTPLETPTPDQRFLLDRLDRPSPRVAAGICLRGVATACIDISDGLIADLAHLLKASQCGAIIDAKKLPLSPSLTRLFGTHAEELALTSGDDYELCFTLPAHHFETIQEEFESMGISVTPIGHITPTPTLQIDHRTHSPTPNTSRGYLHFK